MRTTTPAHTVSPHIADDPARSHAQAAFVSLWVTLRVDRESQDYVDMLRKKYYPDHHNRVGPQMTLFHQLPAGEPAIPRELQLMCDKVSFPLHVTEPYHTGFGVALHMRSPGLINLHGYLQEAFRSWLTIQDRKPIRPHLTIQQQLSGDASRKLLTDLQQAFTPFTAWATGIDTWHYRNDTVQHVEFFGFRHAAAR